MRKALSLLAMCASVCHGSEVSVIPAPNSIEQGEGAFSFDRRTVIVWRGEGTRGVADYLNSELGRSRGFAFPTRRFARSNYIMLTTKGDIIVAVRLAM